MSRVQEIKQRVREIEKILNTKSASDPSVDDLLLELDRIVKELEQELINEVDKVK
jgi:hypothetical protein